jgi:hypothetical protein
MDLLFPRRLEAHVEAALLEIREEELHRRAGVRVGGRQHQLDSQLVEVGFRLLRPMITGVIHQDHRILPILAVLLRQLAGKSTHELHDDILVGVHLGQRAVDFSCRRQSNDHADAWRDSFGGHGVHFSFLAPF